jgi:choline dehydrogenase-like flavoprotein
VSAPAETTYDVVIIGTGAGGGTLARHVAPSGLRILLLERGDWLARRAGELAGRRRVRRQPLHLARHLV